MGEGHLEHMRNLEAALKSQKARNSKLQSELVDVQKVNKALRSEIERLRLRNPHLQWEMCGKKKMYRTKKDTEITIEHFGGRAYTCPVCFCWHITTKPLEAKQ